MVTNLFFDRLDLQLHTTCPANIAPVEPVRIPDTAPTECETLKIYLLKLSAIYRIGSSNEALIY